MSAGRFEVDGNVFFNKKDYDAALRDKDKIEEIKATYDLDDAEDIRQVYALLAGGSYRFESVIGDGFDDEIYKLFTKIKNQPQNTGDEKKKTKSVKQNNSKKKEKNSSSLDDYDDELKALVKAEIKKQELRRKLMILAFSLVALGCFLYFGIYYYQNYRTDNDMENLAQIKEQNKTPGLAFLTDEEDENSKSEGEEAPPEVLEDYKTLLNMNKDLIGWLKIADINIDYPVMQTNDNSYYLDHNFDKKYDKNGCLFLDYQCDVIDRNMNLIIYGHNMQSGKMFGSLSKYSSEDYYKEHPKFEFDTIYEKGAYEIVYVFRSKIYNEDTVVFKYYQFLDAQSEKEFDSNMTEMAKISLYDTGITPKYGDELLTLSTCDYQENNGRFVIVARKIN